MSVSSFPSSFLLNPKSNNKHSTILTLTNYVTKKTVVRRFLVRMGSESGEETTTSTTATSIEAPKEPPSLISALNVEKAFRGIAITDVDHYGRLGLRIGCSYDEVRVAYRNKVNELSSRGLDEEELNNQRQLLKESYTILSSEVERRIYDWSIARNKRPDRYTWPFEVDITQAPQGTPPPKEPEDVGPTIVVGYFLLGWLVLGFALSISLNL